MQQFKIKNVIWVIDFFNDNQQLDKITAKNLSGFLGSVAATPLIYPVCLFPGYTTDGHFPIVEKKLKERLAVIKNLDLQPLKIIAENIYYPPTVGEEATTLLSYAKETNSDLIATTTYSSQEVPSLFLGNLTEELYNNSPLSLFVNNDGCDIKPRIKNIMLPIGPMELSPKESQLIAHIVNSFKAGLTVYDHTYDLTTKLLNYEAVLGDFLRSHQKKLRDRMDTKLSMQKMEFADKIEDLIFISDVNTMSTKDSIIQYQKENDIDLILLTGTRGNSGGRLPDGVVRHILSFATCPVLIIR